MALTMPLWRPHIKDLVCVFVHKDPIKNSISLAANGKKSSHTRALLQSAALCSAPVSTAPLMLPAFSSCIRLMSQQVPDRTCTPRDAPAYRPAAPCLHSSGRGTHTSALDSPMVKLRSML